MDGVFYSMIRRYIDDKLSVMSIAGGGGLQYKELNASITVNAQSTIDTDVLMDKNSILITEIYLSTTSGSNKFNFKLLNGSEKFVLYDSGDKYAFNDVILLPYVDKDNNKKLHLEVTNYDSQNPMTLNLKILGMEVGTA
jgi:hypothetical protein